MNEFFTGGVLEMVMATPVGQWFLALAVTVIAVATPLQLVLRGAKALAKRFTKTERDDLWIGRAQIVLDRVLKAARAVVSLDPDMIKRIEGIFKPIPRSAALNFNQ